MFRISRYLHALNSTTGVTAKPSSVLQGSGPVVIWNLIRRCNLACKHCYATSADIDFPGELDTRKIFSVMDDL
ncbi:MAG: heme d1 biosynthesis radical SAM protein NirJ, partial [Gammaproteobacteria bacterium]